MPRPIVFFLVILSFLITACTDAASDSQTRLSSIAEQLITDEKDAEKFDFGVLYEQPVALAELTRHLALVKARNQNPLYNVGHRTLTKWCQLSSQEITIEIALQLIARNDNAEGYQTARAELDDFLNTFYVSRLPERISITDWQDKRLIRAAITSELQRDQLMDQKFLAMPSADRQALNERFGFEVLAPSFEKQDCARYREATPFLVDVFDNLGWPGLSGYGEDASRELWTLVQHQDHNIELQKRGLELLKQAVEQGDAEKANQAYLEDRIARNERRPQRYGTQVAFTDDGCAPAYGLIEPETVDERRAEIGLEPLVEYYAYNPGC